MRWYFCNGTKYEEFTPLYNDGEHILVQNDETKEYSFGLARDFGTLFGFPVSHSCLPLDELNATLDDMISIDKEYNDINGTLKIYEAMKQAANAT